MSARNKKRIVTSLPQVKQQPFIVLRTPDLTREVAEKQKHRTIAFNSFERLIKQVDAVAMDWYNVHIRIMVGSIAMDEYYNKDNDVVHAFNLALTALEICRVRYELTQEWGLTVNEQTSVREALHVVDALMEGILLPEIKVVLGKALNFYNTITAINKSATKKAREREAMLKELANEFQETNNKDLA